MKRSIFLATLALTPALLHAQATTPAQTSLQARMTPPAALKPASSSNRVSTGIVGPRLTQPLDLTSVAGAHPHVAGKEVSVVVSLMVDATGKPGDLAIAQSGGEALDQEVLAALAASHFQPGTLDGQPSSVPVRLEVIVQRGAQY